MGFSLILWWIKKGIKDVYEIYLTEAKKIYYDDLSSLQLVYVVMGKVSIFLNGKISKFNARDLIIFNQFENKFIYAAMIICF